MLITITIRSDHLFREPEKEEKMKTKMMKQMVGCLVALVLMAGWAGFGQPAAVEAASADPSFTVTEASEFFDWGDGFTFYNLDFTVTNEGYADIREFAIGNNDADGACVNTGPFSPEFLIDGLVAEKIGGSWKTQIGWDAGPIYRPLAWLDGAAGFEVYTSAFLFTSWGYGDTGYSGFLEEGFTDGYWGTTAYFSSPFAAYSEVSGTTITGETSAVPIPPAVLLLGSGLLGLVAVRRRKKG
jgi:hypothetical protein